MSFAAIVLAADRSPPDPVAQISGAPCKSLTPLAGKPLLFRVTEALNQCRSVERIVVCGPQETLWRRLTLPHHDKPLVWVPPAPSPSLSAWRGLEQIPGDMPALLTTADIAFPKAETFDDFCRQAAGGGADVAVGVVPLQLVTERFPEVRRTALKFSDGPFCTCNLFAFLTPKGRELVRFWRRLEQERKRPWRMIRQLGIGLLLRYWFGRLNTAQVADRVERLLGVRVRFVILTDPEAAVDIDTPEDLALAQRWLKSMR
ncbi:MAG TPA: MobA-like NTP transferase domain containing protein [Methylothermaceae bacterium]|nr:MobA-like NTP transferase domain containing protein [Methylothermaceae bacterium]